MLLRPSDLAVRNRWRVFDAEDCADGIEHLDGWAGFASMAGGFSRHRRGRRDSDNPPACRRDILAGPQRRRSWRLGGRLPTPPLAPPRGFSCCWVSRALDRWRPRLWQWTNRLDFSSSPPI